MFRLYALVFLSFVPFRAAARFLDSSGNSTDIQIPEAQGWSGGWCLASVAEAGWLRSAVVNPIMSIVLATALKDGILPLATGTNSGGSMFAVRYFTLRSYSVATKWKYPCYLLSDPYKSVCYFHGSFGSISDECYSETFNTVGMAASMVYSPLVMQYGGPMGTASSYIAVYFPFLSSLPLSKPDLAWHSFVKRYVLFSTQYRIPSNWLVANTLVNPDGAGQPPYNFGFDSYLSRATPAYTVRGSAFTINVKNISVAWICTVSANVNTALSLLPFSIAGKSWDGLTASSPLAPMLKLLSLVISYTMVKSLMARHTLVQTKGIPVMDGGFSDNGPLTPVVAASALISPHRPSWFSSVGASSTMSTVKYLMGSGPMDLWVMSGINVCPFTVGGMCTIISKLRVLAVETLPTSVQKDYYSLTNAFGVYRPEVKLLAPYCGDPLTYDMFEGQCLADSVCDMWTTVVPSKLNKVPFTPDVYVLVFVMAYLQVSPVSSRFVTQYLPQEMWDLEYYAQMDRWFPNFDAISPQKGGVGFTNVAGNSFMDFMTYLNVRLAGYLIRTKIAAYDLTSAGKKPPCDYATYAKVQALTYLEPAFLSKQGLASTPAGAKR